jgi:hypothetical protein
MVLYDIELTKTDPNTPPEIGVIKFRTGNIDFSSNPNPPFVPNAFFFQVINAQGQGRLGYLNTINAVQNDIIWLANGSNTTFPPAPTFFETGDCIHVFVNSSLGVGSNVLIVNENLALLDQIFLNDGEDTWILWQGNNSRFSNQACCVHPDTRVRVPTGSKKIKDIKSGDIVINHKNKPVIVKSNILSIPCKSFIKINKGSLSKGVPTRDLIIRPGHPILVEGKEIDPKILAKKNNGITEIELEPTDVWTLCTEKRDYVMMNDLPVCTWDYQNWKRFAKKNSILYWKL